MASTIIPPGYALLVHRFLLASDPEEMVFTLGVELGSVVDPDDVAGQGVGAFQAAWTPDFWVNESKFVGVTSYIGQDGGASLVGEWIVDQAGTSSAAVLPSNCAMLVRKRTGTAGRRGRGRCYFPNAFISETSVDARGAWTSGPLATRQDTADTWLEELVNARFDNAVVLHTSALVPPTPITKFQVDGIIATQRQRMRN